jgi:hypothetical protein
MRAQFTDEGPAARARDAVLVRRPWTKAERRVVLRGLYGRLLIAIEPVICGTLFGALTVGLILIPLPESAHLPHHDAAIVLSPIFGLVSIAFCAYAAILLVPPVRALIHTFSPICIVDGYLRYRRPDRDTEADSNGYIAILDETRRLVAEWPSIGEEPVVDSVRPALLEFSFYGGIHRIDGRSTGVLPEKMSVCGVGSNAPRF